MLGADNICPSFSEYAKAAGKLWDSMADGESLVLTKWGGAESGAKE